MQNIDHREQTQIPLISSEQNITTNISTTKDGYEGEGFGNPDERALKNNDQHEHHHRSRRNNKWKYAFVGLLALNMVGLANRVQQMHRKREWCREHPQKCEFFKQKHAMRYGRDPAASMPGMFVDFFFPPPPHWMHKFDNKNNDNNDSDWEKNFRVAGETFPKEDLGEADFKAFESFTIPDGWRCKKGGGRGGGGDHHKRAGKGGHHHHGPHDDDDDDDRDNDDFAVVETTVNHDAFARANAEEDAN
jgi:hypothetical protein